MNEKVLVVFATFPDAQTAREITRAIVDEKLAACGNIVPQIESIYRWENKTETANETLVVFKTTTSRYRELEERIRALHPYETPEIIAVSVTVGSANFLKWVTETCR